jgi:hypothetical protein
MSTVNRRLAAAVCAAIVSVSIASVARATTLYASSFEGSSLWRVDTVAMTATQIWNTAPAGQQPDSLCFDSAGNILYSAHFPGGGVRRVNLGASTDTAVATWAGHSTDVALEPSLTTVLCSDYIDPNLRRVNLSGGATVLATGRYFSGVTYVGNRLFANAGNTFQHGGDRILELNPVTGAILNQSAANPAGVNTIGDLDALTYDGFTGHLWSTDEDAGALIETDPNTLATTTHFLPGNAAGGPMLPDGICGNSAGKLWYASRGDFNVYEYDITAGTSTVIVNIYGLDDLAPVAGLGAFPEPAAISLIVLALPLLRRGRRERTLAEAPARLLQAA